jgi:hypothetical protein
MQPLSVSEEAVAAYNARHGINIDPKKILEELEEENRR